MFVIHLGLVGSIGDIVFLGLILLTIWCACVGPVLLEVVDEFGMDTNGTGHDAHEVPGERSSLVGADNGGVCHHLAKTKNINEEVFLSRPFRGESERESHREWKALRTRTGIAGIGGAGGHVEPVKGT